MEPNKVNPKIVFAFMSALIVETFILIPLMGPAFQEHSFVWLGIDAFLILLTTIFMSRYVKSITGEKGPFDFESRKFNGAWWYGKLPYIWFAVQTAIYLPLIPSVTRGGWIWSIGIAAEAIITFGFVLYAMNRIAKIDQPKNKEMQLWTTYFLLMLFLMNPLNRSTLTTGVPVDKMVDQMTANANRTLIIYGVISGTYFLGTTVFAFKMIRASRALHKNGPSAT